MQGRKTPAVAYVTRLIHTTSKSELAAILDDSPLTPQDVELIEDYANGSSYKELALKYNKSVSTINQWKHRVYKELHYFLARKLS